MQTPTKIIIAMLTVGCAMSTIVAQAEEELTVPADMVYIGYGASVMGLDKEEPVIPANAPAAYHDRNRTPASTFTDESPAHMVFLDPYLIDKFEVSNKDYGEFIRSTGHPAPAYWDDPRLNRPTQPVVGISWPDAQA
mgnify:CR=1 FL=1